MRLIIPSAKIVPLDLQNIGKLPPIIYPINDGIAFDFFKEKYASYVSEIDILYFERGYDVEKTLMAVESSVHVRLIKLTELRDLGYTIYQGLAEEDEEILINFADTMVMDYLPLDKDDFIAYVKDFPNETWSFFEISRGEITYICDKMKASGTSKKPLFVGVFKIHSSRFFKHCLEKAFTVEDRKMDSFYLALMMYSKKYPFEDILVEKWCDLGHAKGYYESKLEVRAREFNHISIDKKRGILKKTSEDKEKFIGEIEWYLKLPRDMEYVHPRIFSYSTNYEKPYISMEYYSYHTLHELFLYGDLLYEQWNNIFRHIYFIINDFKRYQLTDGQITGALKDMYLDKTLNRLNSLKTDIKFAILFNYPFTVNGIQYKPLNEICNILSCKIPEILYQVEHFQIIHGDLCFTNIMVDNNFSFIKLIDPRGCFGTKGIYGDVRYEFAKILHSIEGKYDFIIKNLFKLEIYNDVNFTYEIFEPERSMDIREIFLSVFDDELSTVLPETEMIEALLFLSMIPLHRENLQHQYVMLCRGIELMDKIVDLKR